MGVFVCRGGRGRDVKNFLIKIKAEETKMGIKANLKGNNKTSNSSSVKH